MKYLTACSPLAPLAGLTSNPTFRSAAPPRCTLHRTLLCPRWTRQTDVVMLPFVPGFPEGTPCPDLSRCVTAVYVTPFALSHVAPLPPPHTSFSLSPSLSLARASLSLSLLRAYLCLLRTSCLPLSGCPYFPVSLSLCLAVSLSRCLSVSVFPFHSSASPGTRSTPALWIRRGSAVSPPTVRTTSSRGRAPFSSSSFSSSFPPPAVF